MEAGETGAPLGIAAAPVEEEYATLWESVTILNQQMVVTTVLVIGTSMNLATTSCVKD